MFWERAKSPLVGYHTPGWENLQRPDICPKISCERNIFLIRQLLDNIRLGLGLGLGSGLGLGLG